MTERQTKSSSKKAEKTKKPKKVPKLRRKLKKSKKEISEKLNEKVTNLSATEADDPSAPRITNDTVEKHREEVLHGARRLIYPLAHQKHKVLIISIALIVLLLIGSIGTSFLLLYRNKSTGDITYRITEIIPFPVAKVNGEYVNYENYLFEVRTTLHYYENQDSYEFESDGDRITREVKRQALTKVKLDALARQLAEKNGITVSEEEIDEEVAELRGASEETFEDVLKKVYNWDLNDLRRVLELQIIRQKIPAQLDVDTQQQAQAVYDRVLAGDDFGELAAEYSDDNLSKDNGGVIRFRAANADLPTEFIDVAEGLEPDQVSGIVESPIGLHIIKGIENEEGEIEVAHILFLYFNVNEYLQNKLQEAEVVDYINLPEEESTEPEEPLDGNDQPASEPTQ